MLMDWPMDSLHLPADSYETIEEDKLDFAVAAALCLVEDFEQKGI
jgi:hypothetical protein